MSIEHSKPVIYNAGQIIYAQGELPHYFYLIKTGSVQVVREEGSRLIPISILKEHSFIGETTLFSDEKRKTSAITIEDSEIFVIKKSDMRKVLKDCPDWVTNIMVTISDRLNSTMEVLREHRIIEDLENHTNTELNSKELLDLSDKLEDYKERRGLV